MRKRKLSTLKMVSVYMPEPLWIETQEVANNLDMTASAFIRMCIKKGLRKKEERK
jgi:hypothetical protein